MLKKLLFFCLLPLTLCAVDSGGYIGGFGSIDSRKFAYKDFQSLSVGDFYNKYSRKANYGLLLGYSLPVPIFYCAIEGGYNFKERGTTFLSDSVTSISHEISSGRKWSLDILPGISFMMDTFLINGIFGVERGKITFKQTLLGATTHQTSFRKKAWRYGAAFSFYPISDIGIRLSGIVSRYPDKSFTISGESYELKPVTAQVALALILHL